MVERYLDRWDLVPDGDPVVTATARLLPVRRGENILDFGQRGWLAIDPKRLCGERGFDYANLFTNPDLCNPDPPVATVPQHFARRLAIVVERSGVGRQRLLHWIIAWCGLSAAWFIGEGIKPDIDFRVSELAIAELHR